MWKFREKPEPPAAPDAVSNETLKDDSQLTSPIYPNVWCHNTDSYLARRFRLLVTLKVITMCRVFY